jgi:hypothetical protein
MKNHKNLRSEADENNFKQELEQCLLLTLDEVARRYGIAGWKDDDLPHLIPVFNKHAEILTDRIKELSTSYVEWIES